MRILVSGSSGLLGTAVVRAFEAEGHTIVRLVRPQSGSREAAGGNAQIIRWDWVAGELDGGTAGVSAEGADALVHLAGASIAGGRWNVARKHMLRASRIDATRQLISALARLQRPPGVVVAASAIGFYGDRGEEVLTESSAPGGDFLSALCREWEAETQRAVEFGARAVMPRFGIILAAHGGALPRMALPVKLGVGGRLGSGRQWMSWVSLEEAVNMIRFSIASRTLGGPVNAVARDPIRNTDFIGVLAKTLHRAAIFPAPAFALRLALGEMADALLLASQRVKPEKLSGAGYSFIEADLATTLGKIFRKASRS